MAEGRTAAVPDSIQHQLIASLMNGDPIAVFYPGELYDSRESIPYDEDDDPFEDDDYDWYNEEDDQW